jgi:lysophospholipase L1-like esterase
VALWGPYLWADGTKGRAAGDLVYKREDLGGDGTHPSQSGRQKVAELLLRFFKADPYAKGWFLKRSGQ